MAVEETPPGIIAHGWFDLTGDGIYDDLTQIPMTAFYTGVGGGVFCTADELAEWANTLLHKQKVVSQSSLDQIAYFPFFMPRRASDSRMWIRGGEVFT